METSAPKKLKDIPEKTYFKFKPGTDYTYVCYKPTPIMCKVTHALSEKEDYIPIVNLSFGTILCMAPDTEVYMMGAVVQLQPAVLILDGPRKGEQGVVEIKYPVGFMHDNEAVYKVRFDKHTCGMYKASHLKLACDFPTSFDEQAFPLHGAINFEKFQLEV